MNGACATCTVTVAGGLGALGGACGTFVQPIATVGSSGAGTAFSAMTAAVSGTSIGSTVCVQEAIGAPPGLRTAAAAVAAAAPTGPKVLKLRPCNARTPKPPCILASGATTRVLLPSDKSFTLQVTPRPMKVTKVSPTTAAVGSRLTIKGRYLDQVTAVVVGGVEAPIVSKTTKQLVVDVPDGAVTAPVSLIGPTATVTTKQVVTVS